MTALTPYSTGTVSVAAGGTVVTGVGTIWSGVNARAGDRIAIGGAQPIDIKDITDTTHLTLWAPWAGSTQTSVTYTIVQGSPQRFAGAQAMADVSTLVGALNSLGPIFNVPSVATVPDPSLGNDGQYAHQMTTGTWWLKSGGVWVVTGSPVAGYGGTSTTSLVIANSVTRVFTTQAGLAYNGARVRAASAANPANFMEGVCTYSGSTLTMTVDAIGGSGTKTDWVFAVAGAPGGNPIDVCWIVGQSNANASSEAAASGPTVPTGAVLKYQSSALSDANDPVGPGTTGSAWPSFGLTYYRATGRKICFVPTAVGSSAMVAAADLGTGNWSTTGALYATGLAAYRAAVLALVAAGYTIGKQFVIDAQGETDAVAINSATITAAQFQTAKQTMIANMRTDLSLPTLPFFFSLLGASSTSVDAGYVAIQAKQMAICLADPYTKVAFWGADTFPARGIQQASSLHYKQAGYNEMGRELAKNIVDATYVRDWQPLGSGPYTNDTGLIYRGGNVGIGGDQNAIPDRLLHLFTSLYDDVKIEGSGAAGAGFIIKATAAGGRNFNFFSTGNAAGPGGGKLIIWDATSGQGIYLDGATGAIRLTGYTVGIAAFDASGNITATTTPALGTPASCVATNLTGTASGLTAGHVTTNANLTGLVTSSGNATSLNLSQVTNALGSDVALNNTGTFFDGPSVAQGSTGTFFASGSITIKDTAGAAIFFYKLWDGTNVIASGSVTTASASQLVTVSLSGYLASPAGNIRMSCKDNTAATGVISAASGGPNSSVVSAFRIN